MPGIGRKRGHLYADCKTQHGTNERILQHPHPPAKRERETNKGSQQQAYNSNRERRVAGVAAYVGIHLLYDAIRVFPMAGEVGCVVEHTLQDLRFVSCLNRGIVGKSVSLTSVQSKVGAPESKCNTVSIDRSNTKVDRHRGSLGCSPSTLAQILDKLHLDYVLESCIATQVGIAFFLFSSACLFAAAVST